MNTKLIYSQSDTQGGVDFLHFVRRERADVVGEQRFRNANQVITEYSAVVFKPLIDTNLNLGGEAAIISINRGANDRGETLLDKVLAGNNQKNTVFLWIVFRTSINTVQIATFHGSSSSKIGIWYDSTSIASALSSSAWRRKSSMSLASDLCICSLPAEAGVKAIIVLPNGTSSGTLINRLDGMSTVFVIVIRKI